MIYFTFLQQNKLKTSETFKHAINKAGTATTEAIGDKITFSYDKNGNLVKETGLSGKEIIFEYDKKGNILTKLQKVKDGYYDITRFTYDVLSRKITEVTLVESTDVEINSIKNVITDNEYVTRIKSTQSFSYNKNGQLSTKTDANGNTIKFTYDFDNKPIKKTSPDNYSMEYIYDLLGNLIEEKNQKGKSTTYEYDNQNRIIRKKIPAADGTTGVTRYIYDAMGNLKKEIQPNNYVQSLDTAENVETMIGTSYTYDSMNRRVSTISPSGKLIEYIKYDNNGNPVKIIDGIRYKSDAETSQGTVYEYDGLSRVIKTTDALGNTTNFEYNVNGNLTKQTDPLGNTTEYEYNPDGTIKNIKNPDAGIVEYAYDNAGRKTSKKDTLGNITTFSYNAFGKIKEEKDPYDKTTLTKYDLNGNILSAKDKRGSVTYYSYDNNDRLIQKRSPFETDANGNVIYSIENYEYDETGKILKKTQTGTKDKLSKRETSYTYYDNDLLKTEAESSGLIKNSKYDKNGNLIKTETLRDTGKYDIEKYEYNDQNQIIKRIKLVDQDDIYDATNIDNAEELKDAEYPGKIKIITGYEYDVLGNRIKEYTPYSYAYKETDIENRNKYAIVYTYDAQNRPEKIIRKHEQKDVYTQYTYDGNGNKTKEKDERGNEKQFTYDRMNRLETITDSLGNKYTYSYDTEGNKTKETNAKGSTITYAYDKLNRITTTTDPYGRVINKKVYDENGNIIKEIDAKGYNTSIEDNTRYGIINTYNLANLLVKTVDREGAITAYDYNQYGQRTKETDPLGNTTIFEYDMGANLVKVTNEVGVSTYYGYDKAHNKTYTTDGRGKITRYTYGAFGLRKTVTDAENNTTTYKYDLGENVAIMTDKNGNNTVYTYNNREQLVEKIVAETDDSISYTYDEKGNKTGMNDESGETAYIYDAENRLLEIKKAGETQLKYTYDEIGNIQSVTDKKGNLTEYSYDKSSRMETVTSKGKTTSYTYDENGNRASVQYDNGVKEEYKYNKNNKVTTLSNKKSNNEEISSYTYTYDQAGRQTSKTDKNGITKYTYDKAGRIEKEETPKRTTIYAYDASNNRISAAETNIEPQKSKFVDDAVGKVIEYKSKKSEYIYTSANRLLKLTEKMYNEAGKEVLQKNVKYTYDKNGNELGQISTYIAPANVKLRQITKGTVYGDKQTETIDPLIERKNNTYDGYNRLKKTESINAGIRTIVEYTYGGDDIRTGKTVKKSDKAYATETTNMLCDRQYVILETDSAGNTKNRYVRGINYIEREDKEGKQQYYLFNGHGDTVQMVSTDGTVENSYDYDIWGNETLTEEKTANAIRYAGEYYDEESGNYYLRARYYNPYIGRFITEDTYWGEDENPLSLNLYTYCYNDPIMYIDPTGHVGLYNKYGQYRDVPDYVETDLLKNGWSTTV